MKSDEELERKLFSPVPEEVELYTRRLEEMAKKTFENPRESLALHIDTEIPVGRLPHVLYEMGFPLGDVKLHYGVFYKIDGKKHAMPSSFLRNLPDYVSDPYFIVKSKSIDMGDKVDSLLLVSEDRIDGKPISVALALAPMRTKLGYYIIPTVYEHDLISANDTNYFKRWIESKSLVYSRKEMIKWGDEEIKISGRHLWPHPRYNTGLLKDFQPLPIDNVLLKRDIVNLYATAGRFAVLLSGSRLDQKKAWDEYKVAEAYLKERGFRTLNPYESRTRAGIQILLRTKNIHVSHIFPFSINKKWLGRNVQYAMVMPGCPYQAHNISWPLKLFRHACSCRWKSTIPGSRTCVRCRFPPIAILLHGACSNGSLIHASLL